MSANRIESFSDGVLAIVITIMVLSLHRPQGTSFSALRGATPSLLAYALSFIYVAIYWNNHHHLLKTVNRVTGSLMWSNLNLLFWLSLFPFTTAWMSESHFAPDPVATYGVVLVCAALAYFSVQGVIVANQRPDTGLRDALGSDWKGRVSIVGYTIAIPLALWFRWGSLTLFGAIAVLWLIPDRRLEVYLAQRPDEG